MIFLSLPKKYKRILCLILCVFAVVGLCSCAKKTANNGVDKSQSTTQSADVQDSNETENAGQTAQTNAAYEKTLVVYFSCTGNTAQIASYIAEIKNADLLEIEAQKPYTSEDLSMNETSRAYIEQHSNINDVKIKTPDVSFSDYTTVFIGYPIWYGKAPRCICTFLAENDLSSKTVVAFCTSNESAIDESLDELKALQPNAVWKNGIRFDSAETPSGVEQILKEKL